MFHTCLGTGTPFYPLPGCPHTFLSVHPHTDSSPDCTSFSLTYPPTACAQEAHSCPLLNSAGQCSRLTVWLLWPSGVTLLCTTQMHFLIHTGKLEAWASACLQVIRKVTETAGRGAEQRFKCESGLYPGFKNM
uniref:Uncharacterized protein n=1 Tax=Sphaerodactylus townsendi TaxID=933632 RepID=A0ACB8EXJ7_9SAUR